MIVSNDDPSVENVMLLRLMVLLNTHTSSAVVPVLEPGSHPPGDERELGPPRLVSPLTVPPGWSKTVSPGTHSSISLLSAADSQPGSLPAKSIRPSESSSVPLEQAVIGLGFSASSDGETQPGSNG